MSATLTTNGDYVQTNLVSDIGGLASLTDPLLINPWGISRSPTSPFWVSNQGTNTSTLYAVTGGTNVAKVNVNPPPNAFVGIPTTAAGPQGPTGQVNNTNTASFQLTPGTPTTSSRFIFANLNGTISGWAGGQNSTVVATTPGAVYTGLAINTAQDRLYAANSAAGRIDVFNSSFAPVSLPGAFTDPNLPAGFVPFNVQNIGGKVYVTYAPPGRAAEIAATPGLGLVNVFDENGGSLQRLVTGGPLAAPWGVAVAPAGFGQFGGDLLVGNFSFVASEINAFDPLTGAFQGTIPIDVGLGNTPGGLWALNFGSGAGIGGDANILYFNDGINGELKGLFAALAPIDHSTLELPVFRFFDPHDGGNFFTTSATERDQVQATRKDMNFEGVGYNAVNPFSGDPNAAPVFRFFDTHDGGHFFTASAAERDQVLATRNDLNFEGVGYSEHTSQQAGDAPVYRFFETTSGGHFFTASAAERDTVQATRSDMQFEGIAFYAPT